MKYWNNEGKHTELFETIWEKHVPTSGESDHPIGEVVRCFGRINYDMGNNGAGNIFEEKTTREYFSYDDDDDYEEDIEYELVWEEVFDELVSWVGHDMVESLKNECENLVIFGNFDNVKVIDQVGDALGDKISKVYVDSPIPTV
jgi:hypothetical protein